MNESSNQQQRNRWVYAVCVLAVILFGLASRRFPGLFPAALGKYPGDALYALMMFFGLGWLLPRKPTLQVALMAMLVCDAIEFGQLYHAPWLDALRRTTPGRLVLGSGFHALDLLAYAVGTACGALMEAAKRKLKVDS